MAQKLLLNYGKRVLQLSFSLRNTTSRRVNIVDKLQDVPLNTIVELVIRK